MSIFEGFGGVLSMAHPTAAKHGIEIFQTETRNPHLHEEKGGQHLTVEMLLPGLGTIYHSPLCEEETKQVVINDLMQHNAIEPEGEPPVPRFIVPLKNIDVKKLTEAMAEHMESYSALEEHK
jgi:mannosyl-3-phosphoglycerate synthase